jgi:acetamidase/formamidase
MRTVPRDKNFGRPENYAFRSDTEPVLRVEQGEVFAVETEDTYNGVLREDPRRVQPRDMKPYTDHTPFWYNPVCGPIYVNGVESGDVLAVRIVSIDNISRGTVATVPRAHHFAGLLGWEETDEPYTGVISNAGKSTWNYGSRTHTWEQRPFRTLRCSRL